MRFRTKLAGTMRGGIVDTGEFGRRKVGLSRWWAALAAKVAAPAGSIGSAEFPRMSASVSG